MLQPLSWQHIVLFHTLLNVNMSMCIICMHSFFKHVEILCQELTQPGNGSVHYSENLFHIGTVATYECNPGFIITGSVNRTCAQNLINITSTTGDWRGNSTFCEGI